MDVAGEVLFDDFIGQWEVFAVGSAGVGPAAPYRGAPARLAGARVLPSQGVHVVPAGEQGPEQRDLRGRRRAVIDGRPNRRWSRRDSEGRGPRLGRLGPLWLVDTEQAAEPVVLGAHRRQLGPQRGHLVGAIVLSHSGAAFG